MFVCDYPLRPAHEEMLSDIFGWTSTLNIPGWNSGATVLGAFRGIPGEHISNFAEALEIRPSDIFFALARAISGTCSADIEPWSSCHPSIPTCNTWRHKASHHPAHLVRRENVKQTGPLSALRLRFSKLCNMISPAVAARIGVMMGLESSSARKLILPIVCFPLFSPMDIGSCPAELLVLPQIRARASVESVLLAEIFASTAMWRLHWASASSVAYVDVIQLLSSHRAVFVRALQIVEMR